MSSRIGWVGPSLVMKLGRAIARAGLAASVAAGAGCSLEGAPGRPDETVATVSSALATVTGTVTDQGGTPVADVEIQLLDDIGDKTATGFSQANGSYTLEPVGADIPDGTYTVVVTPPAGSIYVPQSFPDTVLAGNSTFDVVLVNASAAYSVTGRILDRGGSPLSGQNVCLSGPGGTCAGTAADGAFDITVPGGTFWLSLGGSFSSGSGTTYFSLSETTPISVTADVSLGDRTLETRALTGQVQDAGGAAVPNASVSVNWPFDISYGSFQGTLEAYGSADASGNFAFTVFPGSGTLRASGAGTPAGTTNVTIVGDTNVTVTLPATHTATGRILDRLGSPVSGQSVCLSGSNGTCANTATNGTYSLSVPSGSYTLSLSGSYSSGSSTSYFSLSETTQISVTGDVSLGDRTLETRTLTGQVQDAGGTAVSNASVSVNWPFNISYGSFQGTLEAYGTADTSGNFAFTAFPGAGTVSASGSGTPTGRTNVTIVGDTNVTVTLPATHTVTGRILDRLGNPVSGQSVCLSGSNGTCATTEANGTYSLLVPSGSYTLSLSGSFSSSTGTSYFSLYETTSVSVTADMALGDRTLETRTVGGRVIDPDGVPTAAVSVQANWPFDISFGSFRGTWEGYGSTGSDGRFAFTGFPGSGRISVHPPSALGLTPFSINNVQISSDYAVGVSVQFLAESATAVISGGEKLTTDDEADAATISDPVETTVILALLAPPSSTVSIEEGPVTIPPPFGYRFLTQQIDITAPGSTDPTDPLVINFLIDCSRFAPAFCDQTTANSVIIFRNGVQVSECNVPGAGDAIPFPCVDDRRIVGDDVSITVNTLAASSWTFALELADDADGDRIVDADDACPNVPEDVDGNEDTDGCPEVEDQDGDGIEDFFDLCPAEAEDIDGNQDTDGCPEVNDTDGDGLDDVVDLCPAEPEDMDGHDDDDGCPETEPPPVPCADFNGDGRVTRRDLRALAQRLGSREGQRRYRARFDLNDDGRISVTDLRLARKQLGDRCER